MLPSSNLARAYPAFITGASTPMADGDYAELPTPVNDFKNLIKLGQDNGARARSLCFESIYSIGGNNAQVAAFLHVVHLISDDIGKNSVANRIRTRRIGTVTFRPSNQFGDGLLIPESEAEIGNVLRVADEVAFEASAYGTQYLRAIGGPADGDGVHAATPVAYQPATADSAHASLWMPDLGGAFAVFLEPPVDVQLNAVVRRYT